MAIKQEQASESMEVGDLPHRAFLFALLRRRRSGLFFRPARRLWRVLGVCLAAFRDLARLPVFALPPAEFLRILMGPDASHTQNSIAAVSAEAARQRCGKRHGTGMLSVDYRCAFFGQSVRNPADSAEFLAH